ncbi:MAG: hypothetical protein [Olavius algarvensis Delta 4 endosymbiont]|nr:MAG: hypothetical protein [Olavius algarvensis Delta 4 endosymbiont]
MNVLAIVGSPRKGKATDTLVDKAIEGIWTKRPASKVKKLHLVERDINYCRNCLTCRDSQTDAPVARCIIRDDMDDINNDILDADALIFGTPVHMGYATAVMMTFLERICWTFAKPEKQVLTIKGCPGPRSDKARKAIIIVTSGIVPPHLRIFCDWATGQIRGVVKDSLNAKVVGDLYAGDIERRGVEHYFEKAGKLGQRLV